MTSKPTPHKAYVWTWLKEAKEPVVAGVLEAVETPGERVLTFAYGSSYLKNPDAQSLYIPELPMTSGRQRPQGGHMSHGVIRDAAPDSWGQRVIMRRLIQRDVRHHDPGEIPLLTFLLESGSNRPGALDFQTSSSEYTPRNHTATVDQLIAAADDLQRGSAIDPAVEEALAAGSSAGGARPKATLRFNGREVIAKFSSLTDPYPVMKAEALAMDLARRVGIDVAPTHLISVHGRPVLLVERFDRTTGGHRLQFVSALTVLGLDEVSARYATYHDLADHIRLRFTHRASTLRELFRRIVLNILVSNTDDHARNHAAFWDGASLSLTPAYDICPQPRIGGEQVQAMSIGSAAGRLSRLSVCVEAAGEYELTSADARSIIEEQITTVHDNWDDAAEVAQLTQQERSDMWGKQILNPYVLEGFKT